MVDSEIPFVDHEDFESVTERDFQQIDFDLYAEEDGRPTRNRVHASENFLAAVEESRILTIEGEQFLFKRLNFLRFRANALQATVRTQRRPKKTEKEIRRLLDEASDTREEIARANLRLILSIVRKHSTSTDEFDEFVAEANAILLNAIDKFDFGRGYRFSTYLTHAVRRHTFRLIDRNIKRRVREQAGSETVSATATAIESDGPADAEVLSATTMIMDRMDQALDKRECFIIRGRFGLDGSEQGKSLRVLGDELGISKERARQILNQSLEKLAKVAKPFESTFE